MTLAAYAGDSPDGAAMTIAAIGKNYRTDRAYTLTSIPDTYACSVLVPYAEADRNNTSDDFIRLALTADATIAVAYDSRATSLPSWLGSWPASGEVITGKETGNGGQSVNFAVRTRHFGSGATVTLGGNRSGGGNAQSGYVLCVVPSCPRPIPTLTQQPQGRLGYPRQGVSFYVEATGAGILTYQWKRNGVDLANGGHYAGVTGPVLTVSNLDYGDGGRYQVVVSDDGCSLVSGEAVLSVATPCDYDGDQDVDQEDFGHFQSCIGSVGNDPLCQDAHRGWRPQCRLRGPCGVSPVS